MMKSYFLAELNFKVSSHIYPCVIFQHILFFLGQSDPIFLKGKKKNRDEVKIVFTVTHIIFKNNNRRKKMTI